MGGHDSGSGQQLTGLSKHFNSLSIIGRRNCVLATFATVGTIVLYFKLKPKKQAAITEK